MTYKVVDPASLMAGPGPHPAASPFDKRVSDELGISAFEVYQVELPPARRRPCGTTIVKMESKTCTPFCTAMDG